MYSMQSDYKVKAVRAAAVLTNSYVAGTTLGVDTQTDGQVENDNQLILLVAFTLGSLTSASIKVEFSPDNSTWYQETFSSKTAGTDTMSLGVHTMSASGNYVIEIPIKYRYIKVSAVGTGTVTNSSMTIDAILGVA